MPQVKQQPKATPCLMLGRAGILFQKAKQFSNYTSFVTTYLTQVILTT